MSRDQTLEATTRFRILPSWQSRGNLSDLTLGPNGAILTNYVTYCRGMTLSQNGPERMG